MSFSFDQIRILRAIAHEGSFKKAAESMFISQPAVSLQVRNLEKAVGAVLFDRSSRSAELTQAGHVLLSYAEQIINIQKEAVRAIGDLESLRGGVLTLGASQTTGTYLMPQLIGMFRQRYPEVSVQLQVRSTRQVAQGVIEGLWGLGIVGGTVPKELSERLEVEDFIDDSFILIAAANHALAGTSLMDNQRLYKEKFITLDPGSTTRRVIDKVLLESGIEPSKLNLEMELSSLEAIKVAVQAGLGIAFIPAIAVHQEISMGVLKQIQVEGLDVHRTLRILTDPKRYVSRATRAFQKEILPQALSLVPFKTL
jgi:DNA-binding transcriptional LysR family regulator